MQEIMITLNNGTCRSIKAIPIVFPEFEDFSFALHQTFEDTGYSITEKISGRRISKGNTIIEAYNTAYSKLKHYGEATLRKAIA